MPIKIRCTCGNIILAPEERVGQTGHCPSCDRAITVDLPDVEAGSRPKQKKQADRPKKSSLFTRLLSLLIYLIFLLLAGGTIGLHWAKTETIAKLEINRPHWLKVFWDANKDIVLTLRSDQRKLYRTVIGSEFPLKDNSGLKKSNHNKSSESVPNTAIPSIPGENELEKIDENPGTENGVHAEQPEQPGNTEQPEPGNTEQPEPENTEQPEPENTEQPEPGNTEQPEPGNTEQPEPGNTEQAEQPK